MDEIQNEIELKIQNNLKTQEELQKQMALLPKGHINILYRKEKGYYYLTYRNGKKICNDYLGPVGKTDTTKIINDLAQREKCKKEIKYLKEEYKQLKKLIKRK